MVAFVYADFCDYKIQREREKERKRKRNKQRGIDSFTKNNVNVNAREKIGNRIAEFNARIWAGAR